MSGNREPVQVIAEIANAHQGKVENAIELAKSAIEAGCIALKFQIYFAHELLTRQHPRYEHFQNQSFSPTEWEEIFKQLRQPGLRIYADVFGEDALKLGVQQNLDGFKVHSSDLANTNLLKELARLKKPVFLATGGSTLVEIQFALKTLLSNPDLEEVVLMHGFQAYPTQLQDVRLDRLKVLQDCFSGDGRVKLGYMDHLSPDQRSSNFTSLLAIPLGAKYLERHITLDRSAKGVDYYSSLEPAEFKTFLKDVKQCCQALGFQSESRPEDFSDAELQYRKTVKKSWIANRDLKAGEKLQSQDFTLKRTLDFINPMPIEELEGRELLLDLKKEETLSNQHLEHKVLAIVVARSNSSRLKNKAILEINQKPALSHLFQRLLLAQELGSINTIAFCTTQENEDDQLVEIAQNYPVKIYRGSTENVLSRMMLAVDSHQDHGVVLRVTGDDLLIDPEYLEKTVKWHLGKNAQYTDAKALPSGTEVEVFNSQTLRLIHTLANDSSGSEYLTNYITENSHQFECTSLEVEPQHHSNLRLTLDTAQDYEVIRTFLEAMKEAGKELNYNLQDIVSWFEKHPEVARKNSSIVQRKAPLAVNTGMNWRELSVHVKVTVYITNFNYAPYLKQSIESVLSQSYRDLELLLIDDGSTDNSREIMEEYRHNKKVSIVYQNNRGLNVSNNIALHLAKGKYLLRLDADDFLNENALLLLAQEMDKDPSLALCFGDYYLVDEEGTIITEEKRHNFANVTLKDQPPHGACTMIRKSTLLELGGYSEEFTRQDGFDLWVKLGKEHKFKNISLPLFCYRQHQSSLSSNSQELLNTRAQIVKKHTQDMNLEALQHLAIIPIRDQDENPLPLETFKGTTLIQYVMDKVLSCPLYKRIVITTPNKKILEEIKSWNEPRVLLDERPRKLASLNTPLEDTVFHILNSYGLQNMDTISLINYEYPLRDPFYLEKAIRSMYLFESDAILSVRLEDGNFYRHQGNGLIPITSPTQLRLEREFLYREEGGIHCVKMGYFLQHRKIIAQRTAHLLMDEKSSFCLRTKEELSELNRSEF